MDNEPDGAEIRNLGDDMSPQDPELFLRLLSTSRHRLFAFIYTVIPNHADAEDVFQEASFVLWSKFQQFDKDRSFLQWACGIAFNVARNHMRAAGRDRLVFSDALLTTIAMERPESLDFVDDRLKTLEGCLGKLNNKDRSLIERVYTDSTSITDIAESMNRALHSWHA